MCYPEGGREHGCVLRATERRLVSAGRVSRLNREEERAWQSRSRTRSRAQTREIAPGRVANEGMTGTYSRKSGTGTNSGPTEGSGKPGTRASNRRRRKRSGAISQGRIQVRMT